MRCSRIMLLITLIFAYGLSGGCATIRGNTYPSEDTLTPGIFLEPEERAILPQGVEIRKVYDKGIQVTKVAEGFRSRLYNDAARYCTIAYGHLVKRESCDGTEPEEFQRGVSEPRGARLLLSDMERAQIPVMTTVKVDLTDGQYAALCDFVYNVGSKNFRRSTLLKVVNARQYDDVPFQFRRYVIAGGKELPGLKARRDREIELFFDGIGKPRAAPSPGEDLSPIDIRRGELGS